MMNPDPTDPAGFSPQVGKRNDSNRKTPSTGQKRYKVFYHQVKKVNKNK
jgi:hypothetical protein